MLRNEKSALSSTAWKGILDYRNLLHLGICWPIGDVKDVNFWLFNWILPLLFKLVPENLNPVINLDDSVDKVYVTSELAP